MSVYDHYENHPDRKNFHVSPEDKFGVRFYENKAHNIHEYRDGAGKLVYGTTSAIGGISKVEGLGNVLNRYSGMVYDHETESLIDAATMSKASERGTRLHGAIEHWVGNKSGKFTQEELAAAVGGLANDEERGAYQAAVNFYEKDPRAKKFNLATAQTELSLSSTQHGYAGTIDVVTGMHGTENKAIIDYKFGREVKRKAGLQTAANRQTLHEQGETAEIERYVMHIPEPSPGGAHLVHLYSEKDHPKVFGSYDEDKTKFLDALTEYHKIGGKRDAVTAHDAEDVAKLEIMKAFETHKEGKKFGLVYVGFGENGEEQKDLLDWYGGVANKMGLKLTDGLQTAKAKGMLYGVTKAENVTKEQREALTETSNVYSALKKKDFAPLQEVKQLWTDAKELRHIQVGETLEAAKGISGKVGNDLFSALSRTDNFKYAAVGGAIGYVGGMAYGALHDTSDPTSTYHEDKHMFGNALKGATAAAATTYGVSAMMNMRASESNAGEMVAYVGNSVRGLGGRMSATVLNAWRATGRLR